MMRRCVNSSSSVRRGGHCHSTRHARCSLTSYCSQACSTARAGSRCGLRSFPPQYLSGSALSNESATSCFNLPFSSSFLQFLLSLGRVHLHSSILLAPLAERLGLSASTGLGSGFSVGDADFNLATTSSRSVLAYTPG
jgi:hypothetical protein